MTRGFWPISATSEHWRCTRRSRVMREKESTAIFPPQSPASTSIDDLCDDASRLVGAHLPGGMLRHIGGTAGAHGLCPSRIGGEHRYRTSERPRVRHWNDQPSPFSPHEL